MKRRSFLQQTIAAGLASKVQSLAAPAQPNIVVVLTDDQRWDSMSCMGHPFLRTPNMDRIAREGAIFRNAFVTTPLCSPSRASFLTGQYARTHGIRDNQDRPDTAAYNNQQSHKLPTFARVLQTAGYETAYLGKWHMGNDDSPKPGWSYWVSFRGQGAYPDPTLNVNGTVEKKHGYLTDILNGMAVDFIRRPRSKPFLLYLGHKAAHDPTIPAERHKALFENEPIPRRPNATRTEDGSRFRGPAEEKIRNQMRTLVSVDEGLGAIMKALEETSQLDNTLVVFTSDNGYFYGEHGYGDKRRAYDESLRIPLLMRFPRLIKPKTEVDRMVLNIDLAPTLLELAGVKPPAGIHGKSVLPLFKTKTPKWRESFVAEYFLDPPYPKTPAWQAIRSERWKYIQYAGDAEPAALYDLQADPYEMKNLHGQPGTEAVLRRLQAEMNAGL